MTDKVNILLVDDQPDKLLAYEVILGELGENSSRLPPDARRCNSCSRMTSPLS